MQAAIDVAKASYKPSPKCLPEEFEPSYVEHGRVLHCLCFARGQELRPVLEALGDLDTQYPLIRASTEQLFNEMKDRIIAVHRHAGTANRSLYALFSIADSRETGAFGPAAQSISAGYGNLDRRIQSAYGNSEYDPWLYAVKKALDRSKAVTTVEIRGRAAQD